VVFRQGSRQAGRGRGGRIPPFQPYATVPRATAPTAALLETQGPGLSRLDASKPHLPEQCAGAHENRSNIHRSFLAEPPRIFNGQHLPHWARTRDKCQACKLITAVCPRARDTRGGRQRRESAVSICCPISSHPWGVEPNELSEASWARNCRAGYLSRGFRERFAGRCGSTAVTRPCEQLLSPAKRWRSSGPTSTACQTSVIDIGTAARSENADLQFPGREGGARRSRSQSCVLWAPQNGRPLTSKDHSGAKVYFKIFA